MPVRKTTNNRNRGYGSFGATVLTQNTDSEFQSNLEKAFIQPILPQTVPPDPQYVVWFVNFRFRIKVQILQENESSLQMYNGRTGKRRYGVCIARMGEYVSSEFFISFDSQVSELFSTSFFYNTIGLIESIPCDEPPSDLDIGLIDNNIWIPKTAGIAEIGWATTPNVISAVPADSVKFYPEPGVLSYVFGGSYVYNVVQVFTQTEYNSILNSSPVINI